MVNPLYLLQAKLAYDQILANKNMSGKAGELYTALWMRQKRMRFLPIENGHGTLAKSLKAAGGKRPDFIVQVDETTVGLFDAKFHSVRASGLFTMTNSELAQYDALSQYLAGQFPQKQFLVTFCLLPKEDNGRVISLVPRANFNAGQPAILHGMPALDLPITAHLADPNFTHPIPQRKFDVTILRSNGFSHPAKGLMRALDENLTWPV